MVIRGAKVPDPFAPCLGHKDTKTFFNYDKMQKKDV